MALEKPIGARQEIQRFLELFDESPNKKAFAAASRIPIRTIENRSLVRSLDKVRQYLARNDDQSRQAISAYFTIITEMGLVANYQPSADEFLDDYMFVRCTASGELISGTMRLFRDPADNTLRFDERYTLYTGRDRDPHLYHHSGYLFANHRLYLLHLRFRSLRLSMIDKVTSDGSVGIPGMTLRFAKKGTAVAYRFLLFSSKKVFQIKTNEEYLRSRLSFTDGDAQTFEVTGWPVE